MHTHVCVCIYEYFSLCMYVCIITHTLTKGSANMYAYTHTFSLCMYLCIITHPLTKDNANMYAYTHTCVCMNFSYVHIIMYYYTPVDQGQCKYSCVRTCVCVWVFFIIYICMYYYTHVHQGQCKYAYIRICVCICLYI
jgi:hypothetical protein